MIVADMINAQVEKKNTKKENYTAEQAYSQGPF